LIVLDDSTTRQSFLRVNLIPDYIVIDQDEASRGLQSVKRTCQMPQT
jgi:hypothetical protein